MQFISTFKVVLPLLPFSPCTKKNTRIVGTADCSAASLFSLFGGMMSNVISEIELTRPPERQRKK
jgi:hypothetical protein